MGTGLLTTFEHLEFTKIGLGDGCIKVRKRKRKSCQKPRPLRPLEPLEVLILSRRKISPERREQRNINHL